jgi:MerR family copper efflux transcriptional regulator
MNIGEAARASGISARMIRHYESIGLLPDSMRSVSGYRRYGPADLQRLAFLRRARDVGFSSDEIAQLLSLWQDELRPSGDVKSLAATHLGRIRARIAELERIAGALTHLVEHCQGDDRPECPILEALATAQSLPDGNASHGMSGRHASPEP